MVTEPTGAAEDSGDLEIEAPSGSLVALGDFAFRELLWEVHDHVAADASHRALVEECLQQLQSVCKEALSGPEFVVAPFDWTPDVRLSTFGSTTQGVALKSSDLDVRMSFEQFCVHDTQRQATYLKAIQAAPGKSFTVVRLVPARLPVLRLRYDSRLDVDVTMGLQMGGNGDVEDGPDRYIAAILDAAVDDGARRFIRLVKAFSKANSLVDAYNGFLNSASWVCVAIYFLQNRGCLPPYEKIARGKPYRRRLWPVRLTLELFRSFFSFVALLGEQPHRISVSKGVCSIVRNRWSSLPLFVEHPSKDSNLAACLSGDKWEHTIACCEETSAALWLVDGASGAEQVASLRRLFVDSRSMAHTGAEAKAPDAELPSAKRQRTGEADGGP